MIQFKVGNLLESIEEFELDGIMNAANCIGPMGAGIAGAIRKYGGKEIQDDAFETCKLGVEPGEAYRTTSGKLKVDGIKYIIHAATMKQPGGETSLEIVKSAFDCALDLAITNKIQKIGCTALGTGVGGLNSVEVAKTMFKIAKEKEINVVFIDFDHNFIQEIILQNSSI